MSTHSLAIISEIRADIEEVEQNAALYEAVNFNARADAIDFLDFHILDRIEGLQGEEPGILRHRAQQLKHDLEKINTGLFAQLREKIRIGVCRGYAFREMIAEYTGYTFGDKDLPVKIGYDNLDLFINGLLIDEAITEPTLKREPEMVFYQKTPVRIILELTEKVALKPADVFFDIGSGLGQVGILLNLICGSTTKGIEYEPVYCDYAKACAVRLNLSGVEFINMDARKSDFSGGTVFFLYTPFEGNMLQEVLDLLQLVARSRTIKVFTYGPCSAQVARQSWLRIVQGHPEDIYDLVEFTSVAI